MDHTLGDPENGLYGANVPLLSTLNLNRVSVCTRMIKVSSDSVLSGALDVRFDCGGRNRRVFGCP
jgi:hypothetical protein